MKFTELSFTKIKGQIEDFLKTEYGKANILFSRASPYGQILSVIENLHQLSMMYLKNILNSFDINNDSATNNRVVRNTAIFAGHNVGRAISATGTIRLSFKPEKNRSDVGSVTFTNKMLLKNENNSLKNQAVNRNLFMSINKIANELNTAALSAEKSLSFLGQGVETLKLIASNLESLEKIGELND